MFIHTGKVHMGSVLQCDAVCCSVLQRVAVLLTPVRCIWAVCSTFLGSVGQVADKIHLNTDIAV